MTAVMQMLMRLGRAHALLAVATAGVAGWITVATTSRFADSAARLAGIGLVVFVVSVVTGSRFAVGVGVFCALIGAMVEIGSAPVQRWERSLVIAGLWYVAAELAWDSMERRDGRHRPMAVTLLRFREMGTVLVISLLATVVAVPLVGAAPPRTLVVLAATVGVVALALVAATRRLRTAGMTLHEDGKSKP